MDPGSLFVIELAAGPISCPNTRQAYFRPTPPPPSSSSNSKTNLHFVKSRTSSRNFVRRINRFKRNSGKKLICLTKDLLVVLQCCGSGLIKSGSGSSILAKYRTGSRSRSRVLMTKIDKNFPLEIFFSTGEKPSALKKEHTRTALRSVKFFDNFYLFL